MEIVKLQRTYSHIKQRCRNPNTKHFKHYGGRGIKCLWNAWEVFYKDMGPSLRRALKKYPGARISLDRIDVNGHYCKENCRWVPIARQASNTTKSIWVTWRGKRMVLKDWTIKLGYQYARCYHLYKRGVTLKEIHKILSKNPGPISHNKSGTVGVHWAKKEKRWCANIHENGKPVWLGEYLTKAEAVKARKMAEIKKARKEGKG